MRLAVVVLVAIVIVFAFTAYMGGSRSGLSGGDGSPQPNADGSFDENSVSAWEPGKSLASGGGVVSGYGPKLKLDNPHIRLGPNQTTTREAPQAPPRSRLLRAAGNIRTARVVVTKGAGVLRVAYECSGDDRQCPQVVCLCLPGAVYAPQQLLACPKGWRNKRLSGHACSEKTAEASLMIYPEAGQLTFSSLGLAAIEAEVR